MATATNPPADPTPAAVTDPLSLLASGTVSLQGQFTLGSNYTFLVQLASPAGTLQAVYKPSRGEQPLWDFPPATLALREVAAFRLSRLLGLKLVPPTVHRADGPYGQGSYQLFIPYDPNYHYFSLTPQDQPGLAAVAFFDLLCNNADRKGSHILYSQDTHHLYAIDHGLCFHEEDKLRTVIWDFAGQPVPPALLQPLSALLGQPTLLHAELSPYLSASELAALTLRAQTLLANPLFPHPPQDKRAFPYPPL